MTTFVLESSSTSSEMGRMFFGMTPSVNTWSLVLAFGISVTIGIIFGLYPARAAAKLDPIEALRHE
jgi:putative ABC transport system permease protein